MLKYFLKLCCLWLFLLGSKCGRGGTVRCREVLVRGRMQWSATCGYCTEERAQIQQRSSGIEGCYVVFM